MYTPMLPSAPTHTPHNTTPRTHTQHHMHTCTLHTLANRHTNKESTPSPHNTHTQKLRVILCYIGSLRTAWDTRVFVLK